jgi:hypothetical protein
MSFGKTRSHRATVRLARPVLGATVACCTTVSAGAAVFVDCPPGSEPSAAADLLLPRGAAALSFRDRCRLGGGDAAALPAVLPTTTGSAAARAASGEVRREGDGEAASTSVDASLGASSSALGRVVPAGCCSSRGGCCWSTGRLGAAGGRARGTRLARGFFAGTAAPPSPVRVGTSALRRGIVVKPHAPKT